MDLSKETSIESSVPMENPSIMSLNSMNLPTEIGPVDINRTALSQDTGSIGKIPVPLDSSIRNARKAPYSTPNSKYEPNSLGVEVNKSNNNEVLNVASLASPLHLQNFAANASQLTAENMTIPGIPHNAHRNTQGETIRHFVFVGPRQHCDAHAMAYPNTPRNNSFPYSNLPPVRSDLTHESIPLCPDVKSMDSLGKNSNKSLHEMLSNLENWARSGLDAAFNRPVKSRSIHIVANLKKKLEFGLHLMKEIVTRLNSLMRAANEFSNSDATLFRGFEQIRSDLMNTGMKMRMIINDIELHASNDYKYVKSISDSGTESADSEDAIEDVESQISGDQISRKSISDQFVMMETSSEDTEQEAEDLNVHLSNRHKLKSILNNSDIIPEVTDREAKPNILITKAYTLVTERLPLLRVQAENFRGMIRAFCSEIDKLV